MDESGYLAEYPVVLSVTRLPQTPDEAPMAVSVIDRRMIEASGARELFELFRLVPGMVVGIKDGGTQALSYHSLSEEHSRRMQVLVDGRSVYSPAWAGVYWADLPVTLDDIERIEVVRGPDAASYGSNAFFGVINIVTREAVLDQGSSARISVGDNGVREGQLRHGGQLQRLDYRLTLAFSQDDGLLQRYDSKRTRLLNFRADYQLGLKDEINLLVGLSDGEREFENVLSDLVLPLEKERSSAFGQIGWQRSFDADNVLSLRFTRSQHDNDETSFSRPGAFPGLTQLYLDYSIHSHRNDLELEHRFSPFDGLRLLWGLGYRVDKVSAPGLFSTQERLGSKVRLLFTSFEWQVASKWTLHGGVLVEDNDLVGTVSSPRLGLNYRLHPHHVLRLVAAQAGRVPSLIEDAIDFRFRAQRLDNGDPWEQPWLAGNPALRPEHILSREIGYNGSFAQRTLVVDVKLFKEEVSDLIYIKWDEEADGSEVQRFHNIDDMTIRGFEADVALNFSHQSWVKLAYAYSDIDSTDYGVKIRYEGSAPRHNVSLLAATVVGRATSLSAAFSFYDNKMKGWDKNEYREAIRRLDLRLARTVPLDTVDVELVLALRNVLGRYETIQLRRPKESVDFINEIGSSAYLSARVVWR